MILVGAQLAGWVASQPNHYFEKQQGGKEIFLVGCRGNVGGHVLASLWSFVELCGALWSFMELCGAVMRSHDSSRQWTFELVEEYDESEE